MRTFAGCPGGTSSTPIQERSEQGRRFSVEKEGRGRRGGGKPLSFFRRKKRCFFVFPRIPCSAKGPKAPMVKYQNKKKKRKRSLQGWTRTSGRRPNYKKEKKRPRSLPVFGEKNPLTVPTWEKGKDGGNCLLIAQGKEKGREPPPSANGAILGRLRQDDNKHYRSNHQE